jgi:hypothetical protein
MAVGRVTPSTNPPCQGTGWRNEVGSTSELRGACRNDPDIAPLIRATCLARPILRAGVEVGFECGGVSLVLNPFYRLGRSPEFYATRR